MGELFTFPASKSKASGLFSPSHGISRTDDVRVPSGIIYIIRYGFRWRDAPREYNPYKTLYNRFVRLSRMVIFNNIFPELSKTAGNDGKVMIDATHLKAHRNTASLLKKRGFPAASDAQEVD